MIIIITTITTTTNFGLSNKITRREKRKIWATNLLRAFG